MIEVRELLLEDLTSPYAKWFDSLSSEAAVKVAIASARMAQGNLSNVKWFSGIGEYKIDVGAGWRIYLAREGDAIIILLGGGSKRTQQRDIDRAIALWNDYKKRRTALNRSKQKT
jgi:putative addiction module killer protein